MKQYVVDAFTDKVFAGNPAAVCVMDKWLSDELMMKITVETTSPRPRSASRRAEIIICAGSPPAARSTCAATRRSLRRM